MIISNHYQRTDFSFSADDAKKVTDYLKKAEKR